MSHLATVHGDPVPTLITDVAVFESSQGIVDGPYDVLLGEGRIAAIHPSGDAAWRARVVLLSDALLVDGGGKTLLPGLIDVHVHLGSTVMVPGRLRVPDLVDNASSFAWCGVTTVVDLATPLSDIERLRKRIDSGRLAGPSIYATGLPFAPVGGHPASTVEAMFPGAIGRYAARHVARQVETADDVDASFADEPTGDAIKVLIDSLPPGTPTLSDAALERINLGAAALGKPVFAHVGRPEDVERALDFGADALVHLPYDGGLTDAQRKRLVDDFLPAAPTLAVWDTVGDLGHGQVHPTDLARMVLTPREERLLADPLADAPDDPAFLTWAAELRSKHDARLAQAYAFEQAGGHLLVGSDSPFLSEPAGSGIHREIDVLIEAGVEPGDALRWATWGNRTFLDPQGHFGAVVEGWDADLLLVNGNPITDPEALHDIADVWIDGRRVQRVAGGR